MAIMDVVELKDVACGHFNKVKAFLSPLVNFKDACNYELAFLSEIDRRGDLYYDEAFVRRSLLRYEKYWLPLAAEHQGQQGDGDGGGPDGTRLAPPMDVHWVWHVHMLSPVAYRKDCEAVTGGTVVDHSLHPMYVLKGMRERTAKLWDARYPEEPFYLSDIAGSTPAGSNANSYRKGDDEDSPGKFVSKISYDIVSAALRQASFFYQARLHGEIYWDIGATRDDLQATPAFLVQDMN